MHGRAMQYKHTHYSAVLGKSGKGRQSTMCRVFPIYHVAHMRMRIKRCKRMASLCNRMGDITGGTSLIHLKV